MRTPKLLSTITLLATIVAAPVAVANPPVADDPALVRVRALLISRTSGASAGFYQTCKLDASKILPLYQEMITWQGKAHSLNDKELRTAYESEERVGRTTQPSKLKPCPTQNHVTEDESNISTFVGSLKALYQNRRHAKALDILGANLPDVNISEANLGRQLENNAEARLALDRAWERHRNDLNYYRTYTNQLAAARSRGTYRPDWTARFFALQDIDAPEELLSVAYPLAGLGSYTAALERAYKIVDSSPL